MEKLPYLCKRDIFCVFFGAVIGFIVWLIVANFIVWLFYSDTNFITPYKAYNPYGVFIQKYCRGDSAGKELAFQEYVGSKAYFDDMRDYGIVLEEIPVLFYDIQCLRDGSSFNTKAYLKDNPEWVINEGIPPTSEAYLVFRDTKHLCKEAGIDYDEWLDNTKGFAESYAKSDKHDTDERLSAYMPYYHTTLGRQLLDEKDLQFSLRVQKMILKDNYCWWDIVSPRNAEYKVNYEWLLSLLSE